MKLVYVTAASLITLYSSVFALIEEVNYVEWPKDKHWTGIEDATDECISGSFAVETVTETREWFPPPIGVWAYPEDLSPDMNTVNLDVNKSQQEKKRKFRRRKKHLKKKYNT